MFHDGSVSALTERVRIMAKLQIGIDLNDRELKDIVSFLESLTGRMPDDFVNAPLLPAMAFGSTTSAPPGTASGN